MLSGRGRFVCSAINTICQVCFLKVDSNELQREVDEILAQYSWNARANFDPRFASLPPALLHSQNNLQTVWPAPRL